MMVEKTCRHCGSPLSSNGFITWGDIKLDMVKGEVLRGARRASITPTETLFIESIIRRKGEASKVQIFEDIYFSRPSCDMPDMKVLDIYVHKLRDILKPLNIKIITNWGLGWSLEVKPILSRNDTSSQSTIDGKAA